MAAPRGGGGGGGDEEDGLPCAAPAPLPAPPLRPPSPLPEVLLLLSPEPAGPEGILRRRHVPARAPRRQVRFLLEDSRPRGGLGRPGPAEEAAAAASDGGRPLVTITVARQEPAAVGAEARGPPAPPGGLGVPVLHSSAALGADVRAAREEGFDAPQAAKQLLRRSFLTRCALGARVGEGMNIPREQQLYQGLVSLQVPEEELLSSAVQEKLALAGPRGPEGRKELPCKGPDLLAFYDPEELFTETAFLEVEGLPPLEMKPRTRDAAATFLMYQKLRQWDT